MASYEEDHNITHTPAPAPRARTRLDIEAHLLPTAQHERPAFPLPTTTPDHLLDEDPTHLRVPAEVLAFLELISSGGGGYGGGRDEGGVPDGFLDTLERVPKRLLRPGMDCPICAEEFIADKYPLVVRLGCHRSHMFDLECIAPWLKNKTTCPLDRKELVKKKVVVVEEKPVDEGDDEEWDENYG